MVLFFSMWLRVCVCVRGIFFFFHFWSWSRVLNISTVQIAALFPSEIMRVLLYAFSCVYVCVFMAPLFTIVSSRPFPANSRKFEDYFGCFFSVSFIPGTEHCWLHICYTYRLLVWIPWNHCVYSNCDRMYAARLSKQLTMYTSVVCVRL